MEVLMKKEIRNIVITAIVALFVGYMIAFVTQTGRYPMTDPVVCEDKAKDKACCSKKHAATEEAATPAAEAAH